MGVGTVTVAMAGAAVSSSDFSSSILGTPGASEDKSFKIFLAKTVCCRDFNKNWGRGGGKVYLTLEKSEKRSKENTGAEWKTHTIFKLLLERIVQSAAHRWAKEPAQTAVLINTRSRCFSTRSSQPQDAAITTFPFSKKHGFLSSVFTCFLLLAT